MLLSLDRVASKCALVANETTGMYKLKADAQAQAKYVCDVTLNKTPLNRGTAAMPLLFSVSLSLS